MKETGEKGDADSIHDLRVAIRRFTQCLRIFPQFFPEGRAGKIRKRLKRIMELTAEVRDRDIALELLDAAGRQGGHTRLAAGLRQEREQAQEKLLERIRRTRLKRLEI